MSKKVTVKLERLVEHDQKAVNTARQEIGKISKSISMFISRLLHAIFFAHHVEHRHLQFVVRARPGQRAGKRGAHTRCRQRLL